MNFVRIVEQIVLFCIADTLLVIQKWVGLLGFFYSFTSKDVSLKHRKVGSFLNT